MDLLHYRHTNYDVMIFFKGMQKKKKNCVKCMIVTDCVADLHIIMPEIPCQKFAAH